MRILMASDFYPPFIGGAERQMQLLGRELALRGHEVMMTTVWHAGQEEQEFDGEVLLFRLHGLLTAVPWFSHDSRRRFHPPFPEPGITWALRRLIRQHRPEVIHASGWIAHSCAAALLGLSIPLIVSVRDPGYVCATRTMVRDGRICDGPTFRTCSSCAVRHYGVAKGLAALGGITQGHVLLKSKLSATASVSTYVDATIRRHLLDAWRPTTSVRALIISDIVLPSDTAVQDIQHDRDDPINDQLPASPFILFVGALRSMKGLDLLLDAYQRIHGPPLVLIGTVWPDTPRSLPPGVVMLADVPHRSVMAAWRRCLFGVAPSILPESLAGVVREGMVSGKAMIATAVGGNPDMIQPGSTGLLVPPNDAMALAAAMQLLIDDDGLRERLGAAAQLAAAEFTGQTIAAYFEQLYQHVVAQRLEPSYEQDTLPLAGR